MGLSLESDDAMKDAETRARKTGQYALDSINLTSSLFAGAGTVAAAIVGGQLQLLNFRGSAALETATICGLGYVFGDMIQLLSHGYKDPFVNLMNAPQVMGYGAALAAATGGLLRMLSPGGLITGYGGEMTEDFIYGTLAYLGSKFAAGYLPSFGVTP